MAVVVEKPNEILQERGKITNSIRKSKNPISTKRIKEYLQFKPTNLVSFSLSLVHSCKTHSFSIVIVSSNYVPELRKNNDKNTTCQKNRKKGPQVGLIEKFHWVS